MAYSIIASITDLARQRLAQQIITGKSFKVTHFQLGSGGHDPSDNTVALVPDSSAVVMSNPVTDLIPITSSGAISNYCIQFTCVANYDIVASISSLGLWATITSSPISDDPDLGSTFLLGVANFPLRNKTDQEVMTFNVTLNF